ncbi:MAG: hypothetical protein ACK5KO_13075 [Arachnia sp.]
MTKTTRLTRGPGFANVITASYQRIHPMTRRNRGERDTTHTTRGEELPSDRMDHSSR